jgi:predicted ATPase
MLTTLAIANYRSLLKLIMPVGQLNVITGPNGSGKSNLYRALRLLAETAQSGVVSALAREGGLHSVFWAGPETISRSMHTGEARHQSGLQRENKRLRLGFSSDDFGYAISLGMPIPVTGSAFNFDPEIKCEALWAGGCYRPTTSLVVRTNAVVKTRSGSKWNILSAQCPGYETMFGHIADPQIAPAVYQMRETIRGWRFYDQFRTDRGAPARLPQLATRTPVLQHDGTDVAAALQTICEIGDSDGLHATIQDAFPGAALNIRATSDGRFSIDFRQQGLLRPLTGTELSDGTLRYLLWVAALLSPRPPSLMVLNEPETSLHPELLEPLGRLIIRSAQNSQIWVISHSVALISALKRNHTCSEIVLEKGLGETRITGQRMLDEPAWNWLD